MDENLAEIIKHANKEIVSGNSFQVLPLLRETLINNPTNSDLHYYISLCYQDNKREKKAIKHAKKACDLNPKPEIYTLHLANLLILGNQIIEAENLVNKILSENKNNYKAKLILAEIQIIKKNPEKARILIEEILLVNPTIFEAWCKKVKVLIIQEENLDEILKAIQIATQYGESKELEYDKIHAYYIHHDFEKAQEAYKKMVQNSPNAFETERANILIQRIKKNKLLPHFPSQSINNALALEENDIEKALTKLNSLIGLKNVKEVINQIVRLVQYNRQRAEILSLDTLDNPTYHLAFYGNPGTGKTTVARILCDIFYSLGLLDVNKLIEVDRSNLVGEFIGQTGPKTKKVIEEAMGGVLFIDEAYSLAPEGNPSNDFGSEAIDTLVKEMEDQRGKFIVIFAGYYEEMQQMIQSNPGLSSRINIQINFDDYTDEEMLEIAHLQAKNNYYTLTENAEKAFLIKINQEKMAPNFANGRTVRNLMESAVREKAYRLSGKPVSREELLVLEDLDFGIDSSELFSKDFENLIDELNSLIGLKAVKEQVQSITNYIRVEKKRQKSNGEVKAPSLHMIFSGNPGTGKTTVARLLSKILGSIGILKKGHLIEVSREDLVGEYTGHTAIKTKNKIKEAYGGVLFIDEAYSLYSSSDSDFGYEAISTLLREMEENRDKLVVIMAGYNAEMESMLNMNSGLKSRFAHSISFPDYSDEELMTIFINSVIRDGYLLTEEAKTKVSQLFTEICETKDEHFGNARAARLLYEKIKISQSNRLANNDMVGDLYQIVAQDIPNLVSI